MRTAASEQSLLQFFRWIMAILLAVIVYHMIESLQGSGAHLWLVSIITVSGFPWNELLYQLGSFINRIQLFLYLGFGVHPFFPGVHSVEFIKTISAISIGINSWLLVYCLDRFFLQPKRRQA